MADDPNEKPPPPEIIVEAADWPYFLRHPADPGERERRARQAADEQRERERELADEQREREQTAHARKAKSEKGRREEEIILKVAEAMISKGTPEEKAWGEAYAILKHVNRHLQLDCLGEASRDRVYRVIKRNWPRLTSLR